MIRRCLETLYWEAFKRSEISVTLNGCLNSNRRMRSLVSSPNAFRAAMQSSPVIALFSVALKQGVSQPQLRITSTLLQRRPDQMNYFHRSNEPKNGEIEPP